MVKRFSLFTLFLLALVAIVPAFGQDAAVDYETVDPTGQTVVFWHQQTGAKAEALDAIVSDFNATNEWKITVEATNQGSYDDIYQKMTSVIASGGEGMPNLVVAYQNQSATYQLTNSLIDINALVDSPKWGLSKDEQADFFPGFFNADVFPTFDGQRLGFPPNRSMEMMYYNADWLKELKAAGAISFDGAPQTPEQFKEAACAATKNPFSKATGDKANSVGYELSLDASRFASWTFAHGGQIFDATTGEYTLNSDGAVAALTFLQGLYKDGCARTVSENFGDQTNFGAGTTLFTVGSSSGITFYAKAVADGAKFDYSVDAIPHTTKDPVMNLYGASVSIPKTTPEQELAAWLFVKFYTNAENQSKWAIASAYFPVRASPANSPELKAQLEADPVYKAAFDLLQYGQAEPSTPGYDAVRTEMGKAMVDIVGGADVKTTLDALNKTANDILASQ